jgi:hypothetical protein
MALTRSEIVATPPTASQPDFSAGSKDNQENSERAMPGAAPDYWKR